MVRLAKILGYGLFFIVALIYFTPKASLYYKAEQELQKHKVILADEEVKEKLFYLELQNTTLYFQTIPSAKVEWMEFKFLVIYNTVHIKNIELSSVVASFIPVHIDDVAIKYTLLNPLNVLATASGEFGTLNASVNLKRRTLLVNLKPSKIMIRNHRNTLREFHKNEVGEYTYEKTF